MLWPQGCAGPWGGRKVGGPACGAESPGWEEGSPSNPVGRYILTGTCPGHLDSGAHNSRSTKEPKRGTHPPEGR